MLDPGASFSLSERLVPKRPSGLIVMVYPLGRLAEDTTSNLR